MTSALDLLMDSDSTVETATLESNGICTIDSRTRTIFVPPEIVVGAVQSDKNAERIQFSCSKIVGDNLDLSKFSIRINFENVSRINSDISIKDQYICEDASINGDNITFSWVVGKNAARYMGTLRFIVCAVKTDSDSNISIEWNTTVAQIPVLEGIEVDQPSLDENNKDVINQLLAITKAASDEAVKNVNSAKEQAITDIQNISQPDKTLTVEGGIADAKATGNAISSLREDLRKLLKEIDIFDYDVFEKLQLSDKGLEVDVSSAYKPERYKITSYIDVSECDTIIVSAYASFAGYGVYCFYDSQKKFIQNGSLVTTIAKPEIDVTNKVVIVPKNAKFVRVSDFYSKERRKLFVGKYNANKAERTVVKTKDKLWLLLGDSLTDNDNDLAYQRYYTIVASPYCTFDNRAVSGSGYIQNNGNSENNIMSKVNALSGNEGYDIISVFAGINDSGNNFGGHGLGVLGDTSTDTMYGAIYNVFNGLQTKFPTSFIFAITPTVTQYRHSVDNEIDQIAGAVKNVCRWLKVPVADVNANCPLKPWIDGNASEYYVDQTHPNDKGHKLIAKSVRGVFDYM